MSKMADRKTVVSLHSERFTASTLSFRVGIVESELAREFGLFPVHDGSNHVEERHRLDEYFHSVRLHFHVFLWFFKGVIQGIGETVASSSFDSQPNPESTLCVFSLQNTLYPLRRSFRLMVGIQLYAQCSIQSKGMRKKE